MDEHQMNKRIKMLAEQAGLGHEQWDTTSQFEAFLEKFAELIVEECGEIAYKAYWDNPETVRGIHIKEQIKEHFGVEE